MIGSELYLSVLLQFSGMIREMKGVKTGSLDIDHCSADWEVVSSISTGGAHSLPLIKTFEHTGVNDGIKDYVIVKILNNKEGQPSDVTYPEN